MQAKKLVKVLEYVIVICNLSQDFLTVLGLKWKHFKLLKQNGQAYKSYHNIVLYLIMILAFWVVNVMMRSGLGFNLKKSVSNQNKF